MRHSLDSDENAVNTVPRKQHTMMGGSLVIYYRNVTQLEYHKGMLLPQECTIVWAKKRIKPFPYSHRSANLHQYKSHNRQNLFVVILLSVQHTHQVLSAVILFVFFFEIFILRLEILIPYLSASYKYGIKHLK